MYIFKVIISFDDPATIQFKTIAKKARFKFGYGTGQHSKDPITKINRLVWSYEALTTDTRKFAAFKKCRGINLRFIRLGTLKSFISKKLLILASYDKRGINKTVLLQEFLQGHASITGQTKKSIQQEARKVINSMIISKDLLKASIGVVLNYKRHKAIWQRLAPMRAQSTLLSEIKSLLPELEKLDKTSNSHWTGEDAFYRFYHHSFKVYQMQEATETIVAAFTKILKKLDYVPERYTLKGVKKLDGLNEWFSTIVKDGTGKKFDLSANDKWLVETRPILEAFFHAKEFLKYMIKYGRGLDKAPNSLPSGWAAVLYLYNLR